MRFYVVAAFDSLQGFYIEMERLKDADNHFCLSGLGIHFVGGRQVATSI